MDDEAASDQMSETPESTLARTRTLLARSRATLNILAKRHTRQDERHDLLTQPTTDTSQ